MSRLPCRIIGAFVLPALGALAAVEAQPFLLPDRWIVVEDALGKYADLTVDEAGHRLLAAHVDDGTVDFFDLETHEILARVELGRVVGLASDARSGLYFASVEDSPHLALIDSHTFKTAGTINLPTNCGALLFSEKDRRIYLTSTEGQCLWVIDPATRRMVATIALSGGPAGLGGNFAAGKVYVTCRDRGQVAVINTRDNKVLAIWPTAPALAPHGIVLDLEHGRMFVAGENGMLVAMDLETGRVIASAPIVPQVGQVAFDSSLGLVYCAGPDWISVVQVSGTRLSPIDPIYTATTATNVAVDPRTHAVWSTFTDGEDSFAKSWKPR
jgi:DNA-binding beta-propeller fold protein YncE